MKKWILIVAALAVVLIMGACAMKETKKIAYTELINPVWPSGNDPWVVRREDSYYYCWSTGNGVYVRKIRDLRDMADEGGSLVWTPEEGTMWSRELWAPELHYIDGNWYIYVAADDGKNENHRMYVLKGTSQDPTAPFEFIGKITDPTDRWAIDGTVLRWKGELYFVWSGWEGTVDVGQQLYIAHMSGPTAIDSERVRISVPDRYWEQRGLPLQEGPVALTDEEKGTAIIVYSASGSWTDAYCLGKLTLTGDDPMDPGSWTKEKDPIFQSGANTYGPGHCSFVTAPDGQLWMLYHANLSAGTGWEGRSCRAQPVSWDGVTLELGDPAIPGEPIPLAVFE